MTRKELASELRQQYPALLTTAAAAEETVGEVFEIIERRIARGEDVRIHDFGVFSARTRKARVARNPKTGEAVSVPARLRMCFKPAARLRDLPQG